MQNSIMDSLWDGRTTINNVFFLVQARFRRTVIKYLSRSILTIPSLQSGVFFGMMLVKMRKTEEDDMLEYGSWSFLVHCSAWGLLDFDL